MAFMEKQLLDRINDLSRSEKEMKARVINRQQLDHSTPTDAPSDAIVVTNRQQLDHLTPNVAPSDETIVRNDMIASTSNSLDKIWESSPVTTIQGGTIRTWSFSNPAVKRVNVLLKTDGRPLDADIELWQGPDNTPCKLKVYVEDGGLRTFNTFIESPRQPNMIRIKNKGPSECPMYGCVGADTGASGECYESIRRTKGELIQGGAVRIYGFDSSVNSVAVMIKTFGLPLHARLELIQGPNNNKQVLYVYTEDGLIRPFLAIIQTPGAGNVIRVVNTGSVEYPIHATVAEQDIGSDDDNVNDSSTYYDDFNNDGLRIFGKW
jgi:hypothetical protein